MRAVTPVAKLVQRARGKRRIRPVAGPGQWHPARASLDAAPGEPPARGRGGHGRAGLLGRRLRLPRTIVSILVPLVIIAIFIGLNRDQLAKVPGLILNASPLLVAAAFAIYYLGFPLRGYRWALLLRGTGFYCPTKDATEIIFLSWLVNCVVPAKLGDVYRAYLLKVNSHASLSRTFGTVFMERVLDLFAIASLGLAAGFWSFRTGLPPEIQVVAAIGVGVVVVLAVGLLFLRSAGHRVLAALPLPRKETVLELYDRFEQGVFGAIGWRALPRLLVITGRIWASESIRLWRVVQALGFPGVSLGLSGAVFVALIGSLLTAVPLSPAGLGIVEAGIVGVLTVAYKVPRRGNRDRPPGPRDQRLLDHRPGVDRYVLSAKPRGEGRIPSRPGGPPPRPEPVGRGPCSASVGTPLRPWHDPGYERVMVPECATLDSWRTRSCRGPHGAPTEE